MNNYIKGRNFEYKIKRYLELQRFTVIRSSGSHGKYDLVAVKWCKPTTIILIQCKAYEGKSEITKKIIKRDIKIYEIWLYKSSWKILKDIVEQNKEK